MICKNTVISQVVCIHCLNIHGQKKVIDTFFEGLNVVIVYKCMACQGLTKRTYTAYSNKPFNGAGYKVEGPEEIDEKDIEYRGFLGVFDSVE